MKQDKKRLQIVASKIKKLESRIALDEFDEDAKANIEKIMCSLSLEEMLYIDDYISRHPS